MIVGYKEQIMVTIKSLGGSGEDSRNCFLISFDQGCILLDCGVRREIADVDIVYPALNQEIVSKLKAVYLTHCHEDHSAALPYLYHLGYHGSVYASKETISLTPSFLTKWQDYVVKNKGILPFEVEDTDKIKFIEINNNNNPYLTKYGHSGHVVGGLWYLFEIEDKKILYTGDMCLDSLLLNQDPLVNADALIIDSAYAGRHIVQQKQYEKLLDSIKDTLNNGGSVLLPVPANGRGIDIYLYIRQHDLPILLDETILKTTNSLSKEKDWLKKTNLFTHDDYSTEIITDDNRENIVLNGKIIITPDGMLTSAKSQYCFNKLKHSNLNKVIITGHSAIGTLARMAQDETYRKQKEINLLVESITIKVHLDSDDILKLTKKVNPNKVVLFHCKEEKCEILKKQLISEGFDVLSNTRDTLEL